MTQIGFVGLGHMGKHMALNLLKSGAELTVGATQPSTFAKFEKRGVRATTNLNELARSAILFLSLPDGDVVKKVLFGDAAIAGPSSNVRIVIDTSTITHKAVLEVASELESRESSSSMRRCQAWKRVRPRHADRHVRRQAVDVRCHQALSRKKLCV